MSAVVSFFVVCFMMRLVMVLMLFSVNWVVMNWDGDYMRFDDDWVSGWSEINTL